MSRLLAEREVALLAKLRLAPRRRPAGFAPGEQRSPVLGGGIEFAEYREYRPGDDLRLLDWAVFLRLRRLLVKVSAEERELALVVILDTSRSMLFGSAEKLLAAKRLAGALGGIAIASGDRAGLCVLGPRLLEPLRPERAKLSLAELFRAAAAVGPVEGGDPVASLRGFAARHGRSCLAVLVSDLLFPAWAAALGELAASGCEAHVVQVLAPEELAPRATGETTFVDLEDGSEAPLFLDEAAAARYGSELGAFLAAVRGECARLSLGYALVPSDAPLAAALHGPLRKAGLLC